MVVEFYESEDTLLLRYEPRDDASWVHGKFDRGDDLIIKGTFRFTREHLVENTSRDEAEEESGILDQQTLDFRVAIVDGPYFSFDTQVLDLDCPLLIHRSAAITWKWFTAEKRTSIFRLIAELKPSRIVIGGDEPDAIPETDFTALISNFPSGHELKRYVLARLGAVIREFSESSVDAERLYRRYVNKRLNKKAKNILGLFRQEEERKYRYLHERLTTMLNSEDSYNESAWQAEILQIILLLNPKYIKAIERAPVRDTYRSTTREIDILLVDASGNVDIIEIKQPFDKCLVTSSQYRDNYVPLRELSGTVMQIEKYIFYLNKWGQTGEEQLTERYRTQLPEGFAIKITNPGGIVIMGRDNNLTEDQRRDFEVIKRKYKNVVDIITYDDLLRRLELVLKQLSADA